MFILSIIKDIIKVNPHNFNKSKINAVTDELNIKYSNKVLHNVGLCIRVWDILDIGDCVIPPSQDGAYHCKIEFRLIVFRPFIGEILECKVQSCGPEGLRVALDFFDDISISNKHLPEGSEFDSTKGLWVWKFEGHRLDIPLNEKIRVRVLKETFVDAQPVKKTSKDVTQPDPPYHIQASIREDGLGLLAWWEADEN